MAHASSEIRIASPQDGSDDSEASIRSALCDHTYPGDSELRSMIEEYAFQALCEETLIKRPRYTFCTSEPDEDNDFLSMTFPRKLWKIVESDQFKSIWWDENGTSIVINEDLFKKEVLERKAPFRIFETESMKSLVRQLNLYGFSKMRQNFQRSASLADFLAEEKEVSVLSKLQFFHNPNFKRGCPQLLVRMKRRVGIKNASPGSSLFQDFNKKPFGADDHVDHHNSGFLAETSEESVFPHSTNVNMPLIRNPATSQIIAKTTAQVRSNFSPPSSTLVRPSEQIVMDRYAISNQLTTFPVHSHSSYTQANTRMVNFITTTASSQNHIISPLQRSYFERMVQPSTFPNRYSYSSVIDGLPPTLQPAGSPSFPMPLMADTSAAPLSRPTPQTP
ncbi:PREDICTED: heat shock transcription factor, Y-linked-like [Miniopterus natalensis]|uniref:heat shock transcription factor, Y-linked-like n=1 Tax=Miniopterus natalensis TaxID=291302 RepID=UPI0007A72656|nr:PREDICTED: heat shock transcription factor, Y-linked-like [Miniopterus natalensis]